MKRVTRQLMMLTLGSCEMITRWTTFLIVTINLTASSAMNSAVMGKNSTDAPHVDCGFMLCAVAQILLKGLCVTGV